MRHTSIFNALWLTLWLSATAVAQTPNTPKPIPKDPAPTLGVSVSADTESANEKHRQDQVTMGSDVIVGKPVDGSVVTLFGNSEVKEAVTDSVVTIAGNTKVWSEVKNGVVGILGDVTTSQRVHQGVVAVLGNVSVDNEVDESVVAVVGNVNLGPHAVVHGSAVSVGGSVNRDPAAVVDAETQSVGGFLSADSGVVPGLRAWVTHALLLGRPLAIGQHLAWVWYLAFAVLALYLLIALAMPKTLRRCAEVLVERPWQVVLTAVLSIVGVPLTLLILLMTIIGIPLIPVFIVALFLAGIVGRVVVIAVMGSWLLKALRQPNAAMVLQVLIGGLLVMALYLIPIIGDVTMHLIGFMGSGAVILAILLRWSAPKLSTAGATSAPASVSHTDASQLHAAMSLDANTGAVTDAQTTAHPQQSAEQALAVELPATFQQRMLALFVDLIFVNILLAGITSFGFIGRHVDDQVGFPNLIPLAVYAAVLWTYRSTTAGGAVFKLRVERKDGKPMDAQTAIIRALSCFLSLFALGLGFFWILRDADNESWHDKISGTRVVQSKQPVPLV
jgi:uncharacterized RDD family membrane protein YckC